MSRPPAHKSYSDEEIIELAIEKFHTDGEIEIDECSEVSRPGEGDHVYVEAWVCLDLEPRLIEFPDAFQREIYRKWKEQVRPRLEDVDAGTPGPIIQFLDWMETALSDLEQEGVL